MHFGNRFQNLQTLSKSLNRPLKYFEKPKFLEELKVIDGWFSSLSNFVNQFTGIILTGENYTMSDLVRLPIVNLKEVVHKLPAMQQAFTEISNASYSYFNNDNLEEEQQYFARLLKSVLYFVSGRNKKEQAIIQVAKVEINNWSQQQEKKKLQQIHALLDDFEQQYGYRAIKPCSFKKEALYDTATIGIEGLDILENNAFWGLSLGLSGLAEADFAFVEIVFVKDGVATGALRFDQNYFKLIHDARNGLEADSTEMQLPLPQQITDELVAPLLGVKIPEKKSLPEIENFVIIMMALWRLTECRQRLSTRNKYESDWLNVLEAEYSKTINDAISNIDASEYNKYKDLIEMIEEGRKLSNKDEFVQLLTMYVQNKIRSSDLKPIS